MQFSVRGLDALRGAAATPDFTSKSCSRDQLGLCLGLRPASFDEKTWLKHRKCLLIWAQNASGYFGYQALTILRGFLPSIPAGDQQRSLAGLQKLPEVHRHLDQSGGSC